ncbi:LysR family transcriptional regulator [Gammaproteobacteria bacterium]|nr:LysR family transcriptional regulator [Gammaproteobacteria bacterium]
MSRSLPPLGWFRSFEASARHLSFTAAAAEIGVTQSAISQQVRALEQRLGVELFVRKARGLALTDEGRKLLPAVGASLQTLAEATRRIDHGSNMRRLSVAASISVVQWLIAPRIDAFLEDHPGQSLRLRGTLWPDDYQRRIADVEIRFGSARQVGREAIRLQPDGLIAVAANPLHGPLAAQTLIEAVGSASAWSNWTQDGEIGPLPEAIIQVDSWGLALDLAQQGQGVALTSALLAARPLADGRIVKVSDRTIESDDGYYLSIDDTVPEAIAFGQWLLTDLGRI